MKEVRNEIEIAAPVQRVWEIITDIERYPEWNTFCPRMSAKKIVVGEEVDLDCQMTEKQLLKNEHEVFLAYEPEKFKVCWGTSRKRGRPGIKSFHWQECVPLDERRTRLVNYEQFYGPLSSVVNLLYGGKLRKAYDKYVQDVKKRAEA
jgi:uncharacterized protein YndB with AHSA1/START domain